MKHLLPVAAIFISGSVYSQIVIGNSDMPDVNDTVRLSTTSDQWSIDPTLTGSNYSWDFSYLTPQAQRLDTFVPVTSTPIAYQVYFNNQFSYPEHKSNYAIPGEDFGFQGFFQVTDVYNFFKNDNNQYKMTGFGAKINGVPMSIRNIPIDTVYQFPLTDPSAYSSFSSWEIPSNGTFYYRQRKWVNAESDGFGTVTTPLGAFNAVRVKLTIEIEDSIYIDAFSFGYITNRPQEIQYHWLANGEDVPVLQINTINGNITSIIYKDLPSSVSVYELAGEQIVHVFPNPAKEFITVSLPEPNGITEIFNPEGKILKSFTNNAGGNNTIYIGDLPSGIYFLRYRGNISDYNARFVVQQ